MGSETLISLRWNGSDTVDIRQVPVCVIPWKPPIDIARRFAVVLWLHLFAGFQEEEKKAFWVHQKLNSLQLFNSVKK